MSNRSAYAFRLPAITTTLQLYVTLGGALSLLGWILNVPRLTDWNGNGISIQPNSCIAVFLAGIALTFLTAGLRLAARITGMLVLAIGASALFEILTRVNLGIDSLLLFDRPWGRTGVIAAGRMGPAGALSWTLLGIAFVLASWPSGKRRYASALAQVTASIALLSLIGYLYGAATLYDRPHTTIIALQTATFIFSASIGLLINIPEYGLMSTLRDPHAGGVFARRILPAFILAPILLGFFRLVGERAGLYDTAFGSALRTVAEIVLFMILLWRISSALSAYAKHRAEAAEALRISRQELETELEDSRRLQLLSTELIVEKDPERLYQSVIDAAVHIMRADFASMQMLYPDRNELRLLAHRGFTSEAATFWEWVGVNSDCSCGVALRKRERIILSDTEHDTSVADPKHKSTYRETGIRAVQSTPLISRSGEIVGMISTHWSTPHQPLERELRLLDILARQAADLIERRRAEQERDELLAKERTARSSAEHAARLKDDFLATLSHELRTPLHAVIGWAQILKKDLLEPEKARVAAEVIERNARLQAQLITDLLDISRIVSGNMRLELQAVDLPAVVQAAIDSIMPAAEAKRVHIQTSITPLEDTVLADPARLQQVVWNLLSNAVKFTPADGTVQVVLAPTNSHAEIRVEDTGEGIDPEFLPHLFKRFRQADPSPSRSHGGLGIGLAIVKQLVELHGGHIRAESEGLGQGATFTIELPLPGRRKDVPSVSLQSPSTVEDSGYLKSARILLVDDEPDAVIMLRRILEDQGAHVDTALSVDTALDLLDTREGFDLLISDISMPERNGYDFIQAVRLRNIDTPAVALTAFARDEDRTKAMRAGYQAHASKPIEARDLLATLSSLLSERSASV